MVVGGIPIPVYPKEAIINKIEGIVYVKCYISKEGEITKVEIERNSTENKELGQSALESAKKIKFRPAKYADKYVDSWVIIPYNFKLK